MEPIKLTNNNCNSCPQNEPSINININTNKNINTNNKFSINNKKILIYPSLPPLPQKEQK